MLTPVVHTVLTLWFVVHQRISKGYTLYYWSTGGTAAYRDHTLVLLCVNCGGENGVVHRLLLQCL